MTNYFQNLYEEALKIVEPNSNFILTIRGTWEILTDVNSYGTIDSIELYYLGGSLGVILLSLIAMPFILNQPAKKYTWRRSWVKY